MSQDLTIPHLPKPHETRLDPKELVVDRVGERPIIPTDEQQAQQADHERLVHLQQQQALQKRHEQQQKNNKHQREPEETEAKQEQEGQGETQSNKSAEHINIYI